MSIFRDSPAGSGLSAEAPDPGGSASLYRYFLELLSLLGLGEPAWAPWAFGTLIVLGTLLSLLPAWSAALRTVTACRSWITARRDPRRARRRALFADHVESQLRRLDEKEEWRDHRFARLEAEVEIEGGQHRGVFGRNHSSRTSLRRVKSLSLALQRSNERLIILQGEPGSGKSVALRNAARRLAVKAMRRQRLDGRIPIYVNLKELRPIDGELDAETIRRFILQQINHANSRDVENFLEDEFHNGMREGTWLFLFDSFDEIPDVLTAVENNDEVNRYADALYSFLHGMNKSPGVVASREFKGPRSFGWPKFAIQRLTYRQKRELIQKADLPASSEASLLGLLSSADPMVLQLSGNPMLLGLLCEYVRETRLSPESSHAVFETFVNSRLERDSERVHKRFSVDHQALRRLAEDVAFRMTATAGLGLSPTRSALAAELSITPDTATEEYRRLDRHLDALEYIKLALAPETSATGADRSFTFSHRRFQEYFATCVVLREPDLVPASELLLNGQWRETAVAMLQTQSGEIVENLLATAQQLLCDGWEAHRRALPTGSTDDEQFEWPANSLHLLSLLSTGLTSPRKGVPEPLRAVVSAMIEAAWSTGLRHHQVWAARASSLATAETQVVILEESFSSGSDLLLGIAYRQTGNLADIPPSLDRHMRIILLHQAGRGRPMFDWPAMRAHLSRLTDPQPKLQAAFLLRHTSAATLALTLLTFITGYLVMENASLPRWCLGFLITVALTTAVQAIDMLIENIGNSIASPLHWAMNLSFHTMMRSVLLLAGVTYAATEGFSPFFDPSTLRIEATWPLIAVMAYTMSWPSSAFLAVALGTGTSMSRWPLLPFLVPPKALHKGIRTGGAIVSGLVASLAVMLLITLPIAFAANWLDVHHPTVAKLAPYAMASLSVAAFTMVSATLARRAEADRRLIRREQDGRTLNETQMRELVQQIRTDAGLRYLARSVSDSRLRCTSDSFFVFDDVMRAACRSRRREAAMRGWRRRVARFGQGVGRPCDGAVSENTIDELAQLIADNSAWRTTATTGERAADGTAQTQSATTESRSR